MFGRECVVVDECACVVCGVTRALVCACGSVWGGCLHVNLYVTVCLPMCDCVRLYAACWSCVSVSGPACENLCSSLCEFMCLRGVCVCL